MHTSVWPPNPHHPGQLHRPRLLRIWALPQRFRHQQCLISFRGVQSARDSLFLAPRDRLSSHGCCCRLLCCSVSCVQRLPKFWGAAEPTKGVQSEVASGALLTEAALIQPALNWSRRAAAQTLGTVLLLIQSVWQAWQATAVQAADQCCRSDTPLRAFDHRSCDVYTQFNLSSSQPVTPF